MSVSKSHCRSMSIVMKKTFEGMEGLETERMNLFTAVNGERVMFDHIIVAFLMLPCAPVS